MAGYRKEVLIRREGAFETWLVQPIDDSLCFEYWMNLIDITGCNASVADDWRKYFKQEYALLSQLADIPEVPMVLSHWDDGESLALVRSAVYGDRLSDTFLEGERLLAAIKAVATALVMFAEKGVVCTSLDAENILVSAQGSVSFADVLPLFTSSSEGEDPLLAFVTQFSVLFCPYLFENTGDAVYEPNETCCRVEGLDEWFLSAQKPSEALPAIADLLDLFESKPLTERDKLEVVSADSLAVGGIVNRKYELLACVGRGATSTVWRTKHLLGEYECSMKVLKDIDGADEFARKEFEVLRSSYHPNIVRIFDLDLLPGSNTFYMIGQYIDGQALCHVDTDNEDIWSYFRDVLSALQYLHRINVLHKDIKPQNIVIDAERAYLIDFNLSSLSSLLIGTMSYKDPQVKELGWSRFSDIYSLVCSFVEIATGQHPFINTDELPSCGITISLKDSIIGISAKTRKRLQQVLNHQVDFEAVPDYLAWFGLTDTADVTVPASVKSEWNIRNGYMLKSLEAMVSDDQARSRAVIVNNILRANKLVGNKTTRSSISAAISALKTNGVVEYHGKKVRLTSDFRTRWKMAMN